MEETKKQERREKNLALDKVLDIETIEANQGTAVILIKTLLKLRAAKLRIQKEQRDTVKLVKLKYQNRLDKAEKEVKKLQEAILTLVGKYQFISLRAAVIKKMQQDQSEKKQEEKQPKEKEEEKQPKEKKEEKQPPEKKEEKPKEKKEEKPKEKEEKKQEGEIKND